MRQLKQLTACYELKPEVQNKFTTKVGTSTGRPTSKISNRHKNEDSGTKIPTKKHGQTKQFVDSKQAGLRPLV